MKKISQKEFQNRRKNLFSNMEENSILIVSGEEEKVRNNDVNYEFRQSSDFWYLTGIEEPEALLILIKKTLKNIFYSRKKKK